MNSVLHVSNLTVPSSGRTFCYALLLRCFITDFKFYYTWVYKFMYSYLKKKPRLVQCKT